MVRYMNIHVKFYAERKADDLKKDDAFNLTFPAFASLELKVCNIPCIQVK